MTHTNNKTVVTDRLDISPQLRKFIQAYPFKPYYYYDSEGQALTDRFVDDLVEKPGSSYFVGTISDSFDCLGVLDYSAFDTEVFGAKMGRISQFINCSENPRPYIMKMCDYFQARNYAFIDAAVNAMESHLLPFFQDEGFRSAGANVTMSLKLSGAAMDSAHVEPSIIRELKDEDFAILSTLAGKTFSDGKRNLNRFVVDGRFSHHDVAELYGRWFANCVSGERAKQVFVAEANGASVGFIACNIVEVKGAWIKIGEVPLNAVAAEYEKQGIYSQLVRRALQWFAAEGCKYVEVKTQLSTLAPQYVWQKYGGRPVKFDYNLHKWLSP